MNLKFLVVAFALLQALESFSTHMVGGNLSYKSLGNNHYELTLVVYRDCNSLSAGFDPQAEIAVYDALTNQYVFSHYLSSPTTSILPVSFPTPCFVPPTTVCVEQAVYKKIVHLAPNSNGYLLSYQRCCRNGSVVNLVNPLTAGMNLHVMIPPVANDSPVFNLVPQFYGCMADTFSHSFQAVDPDGDSLVYRLCTPVDGASFNSPASPNPPPFTPLTWQSPYSATNPLPTTTGVNLNSNTGLLRFKPSMIGQFLISICVEEYRNGSLINTSSFEFQLNLLDCEIIASVPLPPNICKGLTVTFPNASTNSSAFEWDFGVSSTTSDTAVDKSPTYTFPAFGIYTVTLVAKNPGYPKCNDTARQVVGVHPLLSPSITAYSGCFKGHLFQVQVGGAFDSTATFSWSTVPASSTLIPGAFGAASVSFASPVNYQLLVSVSHFGCTEQIISSVTFTNPVADFDKVSTDCLGQNIHPIHKSTGFESLFWDFGIAASANDTSNNINPGFTYPSYGLYTITLIATKNICKDTLKKEVRIFPLLQLDPLALPEPQCHDEHVFQLVPTGIFNTGTQFQWKVYSDDTLLLSSQGEIQNLKLPAENRQYFYQLKIAENGCERMISGTLNTLPEPSAIFSISDTAGCAPKTVTISNRPGQSAVIHNQWFFNDAVVSDSLSLTRTFPEPGLFTFTLVETNEFGCSDTIGRDLSIRVHRTPEAKLYLSRKYALISDPNIVFIDSSQTPYTFFDLGDGTLSRERVNQHRYQAPGIYPYSLICMTEHACVDTIRGEIVIDDLGPAFIPNIFTPNGDEVNDQFFVRGEAITGGRMIITDRWGNKVFETTDLLRGWDGMRGTQPASEGTYFYTLRIEVLNTRIYNFGGSVHLQR